MPTTTKLTTNQLTEKVTVLETKIASLEKRLSNIRDEIFSISQNTPRDATTIATNIINEAIARGAVAVLAPSTVDARDIDHRIALVTDSAPRRRLARRKPPRAAAAVPSPSPSSLIRFLLFSSLRLSPLLFVSLLCFALLFSSRLFS